MKPGQVCLVYQFHGRDPRSAGDDWERLHLARPDIDLAVAETGDSLRITLPPGAPRPAAEGWPAPVQLACTRVVDGAAAGRAAPWLYVVETDVLPEMAQEFNAWYDQEHLPGLAAVPGVVRALRLLRQDGQPTHHACYDLADRSAFNSPPWLAVRATPWSSRVRPAFRNTRRVMHRRTVPLVIPTLMETA